MSIDELCARVDGLARQLAELQQRYTAIVEQREAWRHWCDQNCGRELHPADDDVHTLFAAEKFDRQVLSQRRLP